MDTSVKSDIDDAGAERAARRMRTLEEKLAIVEQATRPGASVAAVAREHGVNAKFGRSSEQLDAQIAQLELSLEELEANAAQAPVAEDSAAAEAAAKSARQVLPGHLPREAHRHELPSGTCNRPKCGGTLRAMGEDVSEVLEYVPEHWKVHRHVRPKYACAGCQSIVQANAPARPIERGYAGPGSSRT